LGYYTVKIKSSFILSRNFSEKSASSFPVGKKGLPQSHQGTKEEWKSGRMERWKGGIKGA
jgi:hypothetical protein